MKTTGKVILIVCLTLLISSCATKIWKPEQRDYTDSEANYALKCVLKESHRSALSSFYKYLETNEQFIPSDYSILESSLNKVVGLSTILNNWKSYVVQSALDSITDLTPTIDKWLENLEFENPKDYVTSSNTSGTELFESLYRDQVRDLISSEFEKLDFSLLNTAISFYNASLKVQSLSYDNIKLLDSVSSESVSDLAERLTDKYFEIFGLSEELYRTTPNAYADSVVSLVFGLI